MSPFYAAQVRDGNSKTFWRVINDAIDASRLLPLLDEIFAPMRQTFSFVFVSDACAALVNPVTPRVGRERSDA